MSDLYQQGSIKVIGVSNFYPSRLVDFCLHNAIQSALNQVECNPFHPQFEAQQTMREYNVAMQSWASFGEGKNDIFTNPAIAQIAKNYNKSNTQVILRWLIQRQIIVIPKTTNKERMIENLNVFDFVLNDKDMQTMVSLELGNLFFSPTDVEKIKTLS